jgi:hypothetical protein
MASAKPAFFFLATQSAADQIGEMFSFIWSNYVGLRELFWQVRGFRDTFSSLTIADVENKFLGGLPMPGGIDLVQVCVKHTWEDHEQEYAKWVLLEACAFYEGWVEKVCSDIFSNNRAPGHAKSLQFPGSVGATGSARGYMAPVAEANLVTSQLVTTELFPTVRSSKLNRWSTINEHLVAYRFFKECRNAFIHSGGYADQKVVDSYNALMAVQAQKPPVFRHLFTIPAPTLGRELRLNLRDCTLVATVVHRMIVTFDAALSVSVKSEEILEDRLLKVISNNPKWKSLPNDADKKAKRIHRLLAAARIPEPRNIGALMNWMKGKGLI